MDTGGFFFEAVTGHAKINLMSMPVQSPPPPSEALCQQCAAPLPVEQGSQYATCRFCGATNYVDKRRVVFHYAVRPTVQEEAAVSALRRWMAGNATVKDLDKKSVIERPVFEMFPMWLVRVRRDGQETVYLEPAAALSVSELKRTTVPAADLVAYDHEMDGVAVPPTVPYEMMQQWLQEEQSIPAGAIHEAALVHMPVYVCKYQFKDQSYTAIVDAATSQVFANIFPSKWEVPYVGLGAAAWAAFFCAALVPAAGYLSGGGAGLAVAIVAYLAIAAVLAVIFFVAAAAISAKV